MRVGAGTDLWTGGTAAVGLEADPVGPTALDDPSAVGVGGRLAVRREGYVLLFAVDPLY